MEKGQVTPLTFLELSKATAWTKGFASAQIPDEPHHFALNNDEVFYCIYKISPEGITQKGSANKYEN